MKPTDFSRSEYMLENLFVASSPGGIEAQEARGQRELVASTTLPIKFNVGTREELENFGVVYGEPDGLFAPVQLPEGWRTEATDHSMWSNLLDDKGRKRASIFYKAAFYDREAFVNVKRRYGLSTYEPCDAAGNPKEWGEHTHFQVTVQDAGTNIHTVGLYKDGDYNESDCLYEEAKLWLETNYPEWESRVAYW